MTREEVMLALGIDEEDVKRGLGATEKAASQFVTNLEGEQKKYTEWYNLELKKREQMEVDAAVRAATRSNRARALLRERAEVRSIAEKVAQAEAEKGIAGGSVPEGWAEQAAAKRAAIELEKKAAEALKDTAEGGHASAGALREFAVLVREGFRGNYTRMLGSASILLQRLGLSATALGGLAAAAAEAAAVIYFAFSSRNAQKGYDQSLVKERDVTERLAKRLTGDIENMQKAGRISKDVADKYLAILAHPTIGRVTEIAKELRPFGDVNKHDAAEVARLQQEHIRKEIEINRENSTLDQRRLDDLVRVVGLKHDMAGLDKHSLEYAQKQLELDDAQHDLDQDNKRVAEEKLAIQRSVNEEQAVYDQAKLRISEIQQRDTERFMPTLQELAHHGGVAGRDARQVERLERRIKRDFFRGDVAGAHSDIDRRNKIYDSLAGRGVVAERPELKEIQKINAEMQLHLKNIAEGRALLKVRAQMGT